MKKSLDTVEPVDIIRAKRLTKCVRRNLRFRYSEVLFHIFYYHWGKENHSLYRGLLYVEVPYIERNLVLDNTFRQSLGPSLYRGSTVVKDVSIYQAIRLRLE